MAPHDAGVRPEAGRRLRPAVLGLRATTGIATSALPCAPVLSVPERRQLARHVLRGLRPRRGR